MYLFNSSHNSPKQYNFCSLEILKTQMGRKGGSRFEASFFFGENFPFFFFGRFFLFLAELEAGGSSELVSYLSNCINQSDHDH